MLSLTSVGIYYYYSAFISFLTTLNADAKADGETFAFFFFLFFGFRFVAVWAKLEYLDLLNSCLFPFSGVKGDGATATTASEFKGDGAITAYGSIQESSDSV